MKELSRSGTCSVDQNDRRAAARMLRFLRVVQDEDPAGRLGALSLRGFSTFLRGTNTGDWGMAAAPEPAPDNLEQPDGGDLVRPSIVLRAARREFILRNLLCNPVVNKELSMVQADHLEALATQLATLDKAGLVLIEPPIPSTSKAVPEPMSARDVQPPHGRAGTTSRTLTTVQA